MAVIELEAKVEGVSAVSARLGRVERQLKDWRPLWEKIRGDFIAIEREQFATQGARGGSAWRPLEPGYARWKATVRPGKPILQFDGDLLESFTGGADFIYRPTADSVTLGSSEFKAQYHQSGENPRPPLVITPRDEQRWSALASGWVSEVIR